MQVWHYSYNFHLGFVTPPSSHSSSSYPPPLGTRVARSKCQFLMMWNWLGLKAENVIYSSPELYLIWPRRPHGRAQACPASLLLRALSWLWYFTAQKSPFIPISHKIRPSSSVISLLPLIEVLSYGSDNVLYALLFHVTYLILSHSMGKGLLSISNLPVRNWGWLGPFSNFLVSVAPSGSGESGPDNHRARAFTAWSCIALWAWCASSWWSRSADLSSLSSLLPFTSRRLWFYHSLNMWCPLKSLTYFPLAVLFLWSVFCHLSICVPSICPL